MFDSTGSSGSLQCRVGSIGTFISEEDGYSSTMTANTFGNLASQTGPSGSVCLSFRFNNTSSYLLSTVADCVSYATSSGASFVSACITDNCGAPAPTWPQCPTMQAATSCYVGAVGPAAAVTALAQLFYGDSDGTSAPAITSVPSGACLSGTATCAALVAGKLLTTAQCPSGQSVTAYQSGVADATSNDNFPTSCTDCASSLFYLNFTSVVACGTNNCNAPTTTTYISSTTTLVGYTTTTLGTLQAAQFSVATSKVLNVTSNSVVVTGVAGVPSVVAGRHHVGLICCGVVLRRHHYGCLGCDY